MKKIKYMLIVTLFIILSFTIGNVALSNSFAEAEEGNIEPIITENTVIEENESSSSSQNTYSRTISFAGYIKWKDDFVGYEEEHPLMYSRVDIVDYNSSTILLTTYTGSSGLYSFILDLDRNINLAIRVYAQSLNTTVYDGFGQVIYMQSFTYQVIITQVASSNTLLFPDFVITMETTSGQAFQISQAVITCDKYMQNLTGSSITPVKVFYPHIEERQTCFYNHVTNTIYLLGPSNSDYMDLHPYSSWDVIMHEYGHHVQNCFNLSSSKGGTHYLGGNMADYYFYNHEDFAFFNSSFPPTYENYKKAGDWLAWGEGWATFFGLVVQQESLNLLGDIKYVGDSWYDAYNNSDWIDYENIGYDAKKGESNEGAVIAVLYDLYDNYSTDPNEKIGACINESFDEIGLGDVTLWNIINTYKPKTLWEFVSICAEHYNATIINNFKLAKILQEVKVAPRLNTLETLTAFTPPTFTWEGDNGSDVYTFTKYDLEFYNDIGTILTLNNLTETSYQLSRAEWNTILTSPGDNFYVHIRAYQIAGNYQTGGYISELHTYNKFDYASESVTFSATMRYWEDIEYLDAWAVKDYFVTFSESRNMMIQTFGSDDTYMQIFNSSGDLLYFDDQYGIDDNSMVLCSVTAGQQYIIRIIAYQDSSTHFKLVMIPATGERQYDDIPILFFEDIMLLHYTNSPIEINASIPENEVLIYRFTVAQSGMYNIYTDMADGSTQYLDTYIYHMSTNGMYMYSGDDNTGGNQQASCTYTFNQGETYVIILSTSDISESGITKLIIERKS